MSTGNDQDSLQFNALVDKAPDPEVGLINADLFSHIECWIDRLPELDQKIISFRFGLRSHPRYTLEQTGVELGITRERVRQIQINALQRLRKMLESQGLNSEDVINDAWGV